MIYPPDRNNIQSDIFVAVNCGAVAEGVLESELFGHVKGAFTGADRDRDGLFALADGGTLFLDEIETMSPAMQTKLLRAVEEKKVRPVGGKDAVPIDVRLVAATNQQLGSLVESGEFREDLYYRLKVFQLRLPPLRERLGDVELLVAHFLQKISGETGAAVRKLHPDCLRALQAYAWPGNVRELENELRRMAVLADDELRLEHLPESISPPGDESELSLQERLRRIERQTILEVLSACEGNISKTARQLGMKRSTLLRKMEKHGIRRSNSAEPQEKQDHDRTQQG